MSVIHRCWLADSPHKGPGTRKMFPFDDVIMFYSLLTPSFRSHTMWWVHSPPNLHNRHTMGCLLWVQALIYVLLRSLWCCMQYCVVMDSAIITVHGFVKRLQYQKGTTKATLNKKALCIGIDCRKRQHFVNILMQFLPSKYLYVYSKSIDVWSKGQILYSQHSFCILGWCDISTLMALVP